MVENREFQLKKSGSPGFIRFFEAFLTRFRQNSLSAPPLGEEYDDEDDNGNSITSSSTLRPVSTTGRPQPRGRGGLNNRARQPTAPPEATTLRPQSSLLRRAKKRVEDIDHRQFHSFLVEPPQGRRSKKSPTSAEASAAASEAASEAKDEAEDNNQKKRGIDWSQKLRERNRRKIWRQFRLN